MAKVPKVRQLPPGRADGIWTSPIWRAAKRSKRTIREQAEAYYNKSDHQRFHQSCSPMREIMDAVHCELMSEAGDLLLNTPHRALPCREAALMVLDCLRAVLASRCLAVLAKEKGGKSDG